MTRSPRVTNRSGTDRALRTALGAWQSSVVVLDTLDPITTELVRMRCARHHDCGT